MTNLNRINMIGKRFNKYDPLPRSYFNIEINIFDDAYNDFVNNFY